MDLSIIIVNWNTAQLVMQCIDSIYHVVPRNSFEIVVVDNGSTDDSVKMIASRFPMVRVIVNDRNLGFAKANNRGMTLSTGRYYLLLNSDTIVLPGALDRLLEFADMYPSIGIVGPKLLNMDGSLQESWASFPSYGSELTGKNIRWRLPFGDSQIAYETDWIMGACMLVRSETVAESGMMDGEYFMYSEETDWCFRIKKDGWKVMYLSTAEIYHLGGGSADRASLLQLSLLYQSKVLFFRKHYGVFHATLLRYGLALANILGIIRRVFLPYWLTKKHSSRQRIIAQSKLIWCLLRDKYPTAN